MQNDVEFLTSRQNPLLVLTAKLSDRKYRESEGVFRFDGKKLLSEALDASLPLVAILLRESNAVSLREIIRCHVLPQACRVAVLPDGLFDRISEERSPEGVICLCKRLVDLHTILAAGATVSFDDTARILFLESVRDPGNLGTIIRSARAFGVDCLVLSADCADLYHARTIRAAMGTLFHQRIVQARDLLSVVRETVKTRRVFAATLSNDAVKLGEVALRRGDAVIVGNEGHGLSADLIEAATQSIYIPMERGVESLNAGVAASVLLWEFYHNR